jgi:hypothetical protein
MGFSDHEHLLARVAMKLMDINAKSSEQAHEHLLGDFDTLVTENTNVYVPFVPHSWS